MFQMKNIPTYNVNSFLDFLIKELEVKNDAGLAEYFGLNRSTICKYRKHVNSVRSEFILNVHEELGMSFKEIRQRLGVPDNYVFDHATKRQRKE